MATTKTTKKKTTKKKNGKKAVSVKRNGKTLYGAVALHILKKRAAKKRAAAAKANPKKKAVKKNVSKKRTAPKRNVEMGFWKAGVFHPIRSSETYQEGRKPSKKASVVKAKQKAASTSRLTAQKVAGSLVKKAAVRSLTKTTSSGKTLKKAKRNFASRRPYRNPEAGQLFEMFTGQSHTGHEVVTAPTGAPSNLDQCGQFVEFKWIDLDGKRHTVNLEGQGIPAILAAHRYANGHDELFLVSAPGLPLPNFGDYLPHGDNGFIYEVTYRAQKAHLGDTKPQLYYHKLGEETGQPPVLHINKQGELIFKGGEYWLEATGIHN